MRSFSAWLAAAAALSLMACYAELPGSAVEGDFDGGGLGGNAAGGTTGTTGGPAGGGTPGGGMSDGGTSDDLDASTSDASEPTSCDGVGIGTMQQRVRYAAVQVVAPDKCKSEVQQRTCTTSGFTAWSGSYQAESCSVGTLRSCGATPSGQSETRQRYPVDETDDVSDCEAETQMRLCTDGSWGEWSGEAEHETCRVSFLGTCGVSGLFTGSMCEPDTTCKVKGLSWPRCLGNGGHECDANGDCVFTCVDEECTAADPARGGACDDAADCANTLCPSVNGGTATAGCVANACVCPAGSLCTTNAQCSGTCVAQSAFISTCVALNTTCDNNDDCRGDHRCVKAGMATTGMCLLPDGKPCTADAQCEHVCRPSGSGQVCAPLGKANESCEQNTDCQEMLRCRPLGASAVCAAPGGLTEACDEDADCAGNMGCSTQLRLCLPGSGAACVPMVAAQCASGSCVSCSGEPGCPPTGGKCQ